MMSFFEIPVFYCKMYANFKICVLFTFFFFNFKYIVKKYNIGLTDEEVTTVINMIDPTEENTSYLYQIVANKLNGLDCDKFD